MNKLTPAEERVIVQKGTERPFSGEYDNFFKEGTYICRRCNTPLYVSTRRGVWLVVGDTITLVETRPAQ